MNGCDGGGVRLLGSLAVYTGTVCSKSLLDGSEYSGAVRDGKPHGQGYRRCSENGVVVAYERGEFRNGKFHGRGSVYRDGEITLL